MATSRRASALRRVDLPALGGPAITTTKPSRKRSAAPAFASSTAISAIIASTLARTSRTKSPATSPSSEKSIALSAAARAASRRRRWRSTQTPSAPSSCRSACRRCASVSASIRSASPSTAARSILPLRRARRVKAPGSAGRQPGTAAKAPSTEATTCAAPVQVQLRAILAGEAGRRGKPEDQAVIEGVSGYGVPQPAQRRRAWRGQGTGQSRQNGAGRRARHADDGDGRTGRPRR